MRKLLAMWIPLSLLLGGVACVDSTETADTTAEPGAAAVQRVESRGETTPFDGYTLFQPLRSTNVYLVDMDGNLAHKWETEYNPGQSVYMLENGNLLRTARDPDPTGPYRGGGRGLPGYCDP